MNEPTTPAPAPLRVDRAERDYLAAHAHDLMDEAAGVISTGASDGARKDASTTIAMMALLLGNIGFEREAPPSVTGVFSINPDLLPLQLGRELLPLDLYPWLAQFRKQDGAELQEFEGQLEICLLHQREGDESKQPALLAEEATLRRDIANANRRVAYGLALQSRLLGGDA